MSSFDHLLPPLKEVIKHYQLSAHKSLGQNFLLDMQLLTKIAYIAGASSGDDFIEIGPGPGGLTRALLAQGARKVIAIEKDIRCVPILEQIKSVYPERLEIIQADALEINLAELYAHPFRIATNLPYNISSSFITRLLTQIEMRQKWLSATLMLQKEFALRMKASENSKIYGRLSVLCAHSCHTELKFDVHPSNFTPSPKVMSAITQLTPLERPPICDLARLADITRATFGQRRKMLKTSLKRITDDPIALCQKAQIDPHKRADQLSPQEYALLVRETEKQ